MYRARCQRETRQLRVKLLSSCFMTTKNGLVFHSPTNTASIPRSTYSKDSLDTGHVTDSRQPTVHIAARLRRLSSVSLKRSHETTRSYHPGVTSPQFPTVASNASCRAKRAIEKRSKIPGAVNKKTTDSTKEEARAPQYDASRLRS